MRLTKEPLTLDAARRHAKKWLDNRVDKPTARYWRSEFRNLMHELGERAIAATVDCSGDEFALNEHLSDAQDTLLSIWMLSAPAGLSWFDGEQKVDEAEVKARERAHVVLWRRHNPLTALKEGLKSEHQVRLDPRDLDETIADYLARPWLSHARLDWILLDLKVTFEVCAFGETYKERSLPGPRDPYLGGHAHYIKALGNLAEMQKVDWSAKFGRWESFAIWALAVPIGGIWVAFHFGYQDLGWWLLMIYLAVVLVFVGLRLCRWAPRLIRRFRGQQEPHIRLIGLWDRMYEVWRRLEGPVVHPVRVREAMVIAEAQGARWGSTVWALIDQAIARDPAVWLVEPSRS